MKNIVVGVTGSIAAYKACDVVSTLRKIDNLNVQVVMTEAATQFVTAMTFEALTGNPVYTNVFETTQEWDLLHTTLSEKADLILVCPATMNIIGKLANGLCDDLVTSTIFASQAPVLLVPAMNTQMYQQPATQENLAKLAARGVQCVDPIEGVLACQTVGVGHIAETDSIVAKVQDVLGLHSATT